VIRGEKPISFGSLSPDGSVQKTWRLIWVDAVAGVLNKEETKEKEQKLGDWERFHDRAGVTDWLPPRCKTCDD